MLPKTESEIWAMRDKEQEFLGDKEPDRGRGAARTRFFHVKKAGSRENSV